MIEQKIYVYFVILMFILIIKLYLGPVITFGGTSLPFHSSYILLIINPNLELLSHPFPAHVLARHVY